MAGALLGSGGHCSSLRHKWTMGGVMPPQVLPQAEDWAACLKTELPSDPELSEQRRLQVRLRPQGAS